MKYYRLSEHHPLYGIAGNVIPEDTWKRIGWADRPLYDPVDEYGVGYGYKVELKNHASASPSLFYIEGYAELVILMTHVMKRTKQHELPLIIPRKDAMLMIEKIEIKIIYREAWDADHKN